jgi:hypothetical protein
VTIEAVAEEGAPARLRLLALVPIVLLAGALSLFAAFGGSLTGLVGERPPQPDEFEIRRVELSPGEIRIRVTNPQQDDLTIASVAVDDAVVPFAVEGSQTLSRLRSATVVVEYDWVRDEPLAVGVTSSTGIETTEELAAAVPTPQPSPRGFLGYAVIGTSPSRWGCCGCRRCAEPRRNGSPPSWPSRPDCWPSSPSTRSPRRSSSRLRCRARSAGPASFSSDWRSAI